MPDILNDAHLDQTKLTSYALGELSPGDSGDVELWLSGDPAARRYVEMVREEASVLRRAFAARAEGLSDEQHEALTDAIGDRPPRPVLPTLVGIMGVVAALILFLVVVYPETQAPQPEAGEQPGPPLAATETPTPTEPTTAPGEPVTPPAPTTVIPPEASPSAPTHPPFYAQATLQAANVTPALAISPAEASTIVRVEVSHAPWAPEHRLALIRIDPRQPGVLTPVELLINKQLVASARLHGDLFGPLDLAADSILLTSGSAESGEGSGRYGDAGAGQFYLVEYVPTRVPATDALRQKIASREEAIAGIQALMQDLPDARRPSLEAEIITHRDAITDLRAQLAAAQQTPPAALSISLGGPFPGTRLTLPIPDAGDTAGGTLAPPSHDFNFAAAVAAFDLTQRNPTATPADYDLALELAELGQSPDPTTPAAPARAAFLERVRQAANP